MRETYLQGFLNRLVSGDLEEKWKVQKLELMEKYVKELRALKGTRNDTTFYRNKIRTNYENNFESVRPPL